MVGNDKYPNSLLVPYTEIRLSIHKVENICFRKQLLQYVRSS